MRKYILALLFITICVAISHGQKRQDKKQSVSTYYDPCIVPQPVTVTNPPMAMSTSPKCVIPGTVTQPIVIRPFPNPRNYPTPVLSIQIKLAGTRINRLDDLKFTLDMANNTSRKQTFLFDRRVNNGTFLFGASCYITNSKNQSILKYTNKGMLDTVNYYKKLDSYYYTLEPSEWLKKQYSVTNLVVLDSAICKKGKIPRDTYTLRLVFQNNYSNEVEFVAE